MSIEVREVSKFYGSQKALDTISFSIKKGEIVGFLGPNGAGKTTLFKTLSGLILPDRGSASIFGCDIVERFDDVQSLLVPVIPEERSLFWRLSAQENLRLFAALQGLRGSVANERVRETLKII